MFKCFNRPNTSSAIQDTLLDTFVKTEQSLHALPELSPDEKVGFEQNIAISHLYNSSRIEGSQLNGTQLTKAING